jgi:hypothetical protein
MILGATANEGSFGRSAPGPGCASGTNERDGWLTRTRFAVLVLAVTAIGLVLRVWEVFDPRSLRSDESMVAENILSRSFVELLEPLAYRQSAPVGWLWVQKAITDVLPNFEVSLRLFPLVSGIAALICFAWLAVRYLPRLEALFCVVTLSLVPTYLFGAADAKQYTTDVAVSALVVLLACRVLAADRLRGGDVAALLAVGIAGVLLSHPAAFVLAGAGAGLFVHFALARRVRPAAVIAATSAAWLAVFAAMYFGVYRAHAALVTDMQQRWSWNFIPFPPSGLKDFWTYAKVVTRPAEAAFYGGYGTPSPIFYDPFWPIATVFVSFLFIVGAVLLLRRSLGAGLVMVVPVVVTAAASVLQLYPFSGRFLVFLGPQVIVCAAIGLGALWRSPTVPRWTGALAAALILLVPLAVSAQSYLRSGPPFATEDLQRMFTTLAQRIEPGEVIYVNAAGLQQFRLYAERFGLDDVKVVGGRGADDHPDHFLADIERVRQYPRVWAVFLRDRPYDKYTVWKLTDVHVFARLAGVYGNVLERHDFPINDSTLLLLAFPPEVQAERPVLFAEPDAPYEPFHPSRLLQPDER